MLVFKNQYNEFKRSPIGFSFTMLFFGALVPMLRKDWKWTGIALIPGILAMIYPGLGILALIPPFLYNKYYIRDLLEQGFYPVDEGHARLIVSYKVVTLEEMRGHKFRASMGGIANDVAHRSGGVEI